MGMWTEIPLADAPYLKLTHTQRHKPYSDISVETAVREALEAIEALRHLFAEKLKTERPRLEQLQVDLDQIKGIVEPTEEPASTNADLRWVTTIGALRQAKALSESILRLAEFISLPAEVKNQFGINEDPGPRELERAIVAYLEHLIFILRGDPNNQNGYAPLLPERLDRHFLVLWFKGGTWWSLDPGRTLRMDEHDGGPRALAYWGDPVALAHQIERWSAWLAVQTIPVRERPTTYNSINTILALKEKGYSGPKIASELGITYEAVKMALMRHERRLSKEREEQAKKSTLDSP
jgi:hypothetical protein